jgi:tetratricopeptide (TPR) repeat protein
MHRIVSGILAGCLLISPALFGESLEVEGIVARNLGTVALIHGKRTDNGASVQGSGCVVHPGGFILATAHQANGVSNFSAKFADGSTVPLELVATQPETEFALFKADKPLREFATLGDASLLRGGAALISIASPVNLEFTTVTGTVANANKTYEGYDVFLASLTATHGSSGGPVFDRRGHLVGLISGGLNEVDFTIVNKINNAFPLLRSHGILADHAQAPPEEDVLVPVAGISEAELRAVEAYNRGVAATDSSEKIEAYGLAFTLLPAFYEARFNLAVAEARAGAVDQAVASYRKAELLRPDAVEVKRNLGRLYLTTKAYKEAIAVFETALQLAPGAAQSHNDLGEAHRRAGDFSAAVRYFKACLEINNNAPNVHYNLALAYANSNKPDDAVRHFRAYLSLSPDASDAAKVQATIEKLEAS